MDPIKFIAERKVRRYIINEFSNDDLNFLNKYAQIIYSIPIKGADDSCNCFVINLPAFCELYNNEPEITHQISTSIIKAIIDSNDLEFNEIEFII